MIISQLVQLPKSQMHWLGPGMTVEDMRQHSWHAVGHMAGLQLPWLTTAQAATELYL